MELLLIAIVISAMLVFYPIRVRPRADLISPPTISTRFTKSFDSQFFRDPSRFPDGFYDYTSKRGEGNCSICDADPCSLCGSTDCGNEYYICSLCSGREDDMCPYCSPLTHNSSDFSRFRLDGNESMFGNNDAFLSEDFDTGLYNHEDSLMASSSFSDLAVGHGEPVTEVFFYEGKRYIAATYSDTIVIRPADL